MSGGAPGPHLARRSRSPWAYWRRWGLLLLALQLVPAVFTVVGLWGWPCIFNAWQDRFRPPAPDRFAALQTRARPSGTMPG